MKYKLIVMDVDNTLLCTDKSVSKKNLEAIKKCKDKGIMVSLASGRPALDVLHYAKMIGIEDNYHISDNGAGIFKGNDRKIIKTFNHDFYRCVYETGVIIASGIGGIETIENAQMNMEKRGPSKVSPYFIPMCLINLSLIHI